MTRPVAKAKAQPGLELSASRLPTANRSTASMTFHVDAAAAGRGEHAFLYKGLLT
jgi:hypothetical protein